MCMNVYECLGLSDGNISIGALMKTPNRVGVASM